MIWIVQTSFLQNMAVQDGSLYSCIFELLYGYANLESLIQTYTLIPILHEQVAGNRAFFCTSESSLAHYVLPGAPGSERIHLNL